MQNKEFENLQDGANSLSLNKESPSLGYANEKKEYEIDKYVEVDKFNCQELDQKQKLRQPQAENRTTFETGATLKKENGKF